MEACKFYVFKSNKVILDDIGGSIDSINLYDSNDTLIEGLSYTNNLGKIVLNLTNVNYEQQLNLVGRDKENNILLNEYIEFVPGSTYSKEEILKLFIDEKEIENIHDFNIGKLTNETSYIDFSIKNTSSTEIAKEISISIFKHSSFSIGDKYVYIAEKQENVSNEYLPYVKNLKIDKIYSEDTRKFVLKIIRDKYDVSASGDYNKFKLVINRGE